MLSSSWNTISMSGVSLADRVVRRYAWASSKRSTLTLVGVATSCRPLRTFETVERETPACSAT